MSFISGILCALWVFQNVSLVLTSKWVFSAAFFDFPYSIICLQSILICTSMLSVYFFSSKNIPRFNIRSILDALLPSLLLNLYSYSNARALRFVSLPAFTAVKALTPLFITAIELSEFGDKVSGGVILALALAVIGNAFTFESASVLSGLSHHGYAWALFNIITNAVYVLTIRYYSGSSKERPLLINFCGLIFTVPLAILNKEPYQFINHVKTLSLTQIIPLFLCVSLGATAYVFAYYIVEFEFSGVSTYIATAASVSRVMIVLFGAYVFRTQLSRFGWFGVFLAVLSGFIYSAAKSRIPDPKLAARPIVNSPTLELLFPVGTPYDADMESLTTNSKRSDGT